MRHCGTLGSIEKTSGNIKQSQGKLWEMLDNVEKTLGDDNGKENDKG